MAGTDTSGDIRVDEDRRHYFRLIGLEASESRIKMLHKRVNAIRYPMGQGTPRNRALTYRSDRNDRGDASGLANNGDSDVLARGSTSMVNASGGKAGKAPAAAANSACRRQAAMSSVAPAHKQMKDDMESARRELQGRVRKFREDFLDMEWKQQWEVSLLQRPTELELEDPTSRNFSMCRRPHQKVVVGKDLKEIEGMPSHKLCINDSLKRSLGKMRDNLFQRRLNLAIYEKTINEWSLPQLCAEARRKRRGAAVQQGAHRSTSVGPGWQPPGNTITASDKSTILPGTNAVPSVTTAVVPGTNLESELPVYSDAET